jgi:hypothetical protein
LKHAAGESTEILPFLQPAAVRLAGEQFVLAASDGRPVRHGEFLMADETHPCETVASSPMPITSAPVAVAGKRSQIEKCES